jgi:hypothetical protein
LPRATAKALDARNRLEKQGRNADRKKLKRPGTVLALGHSSPAMNGRLRETRTTVLLDEETIRVLAVNCRVSGGAGEVDVTDVDSVAAVLSAVRLMQFDLLLTSSTIAGLAVWPLAQKVRRVRPKLRWWLVARGLSDDQEVLARTLGVTRILESAPTGELIRAALSRGPVLSRNTADMPSPLATSA